MSFYRFTMACFAALAITWPGVALGTERTTDLIPATWNGIRWQDGAWTLTRPVQPDTNGALWLNAAEADAIDLLPACRSWIEETPGAVGGKAIRQGLWNRNLISFDVRIPRTGKYRPWFRVRLARKEISPVYDPSVTYQVDRDPLQVVELKTQGKDYLRELYFKQEWVWLPGTEMEIKAGYRTFRVRAGLDYSWLDRVCLAPAGGSAPQGAGGQSPREPAPEAEVNFQPLSGALTGSLQRILTRFQAEGGQIIYSFSRDDARTWTPLSGDSLAGLSATTNVPSGDVFLRCAISPVSNGIAPRVIGWQATLDPATPLPIEITNAEQKIIFDRASGDLLGWWSAKAGWIVPPLRRQPLFEIGILTNRSQITFGGLLPPRGELKPTAKELKRCAVSEENGVQVLALEYRLLDGAIRADIHIELPPSGLARWKMKVENRSGVELYGLNFPLIAGVRIGNQPESNRLPAIDGMTGEASGAIFGPVPTARHRSGIYPGWTSMGWYSLFDKDGLGAFTLQTRNRDGYHIWMADMNDPIALAREYRFARMLVIGPGEDGSADYELGWHAGDWHRSADLYRDWITTWMTGPDLPQWVREADGWQDGGAYIASRYMTHGWPNMEWLGVNFSGNFGRAMDATITCTDFPFVNPRLGTAEDFRRAHDAARQAGWRNVYYWNWRAWNDAFADAPYIRCTPRSLLPPEIRLRPRGFVEQYGLRNQNGNLERADLGASAYVFSGDYSMCPGSTGWKDMLVDGIAYNYGTLLGADGVYLDQSGNAAAFCISTNHGHDRQGAIAGEGMTEVFRRSIETGRIHNDGFTIVIESNGERYMQYANFGLWVRVPYLEGNIFQYVHPSAKMLYGNNNNGGLLCTPGEFSRYLNLFHCNDMVGTHREIREFYAHRKRIGDWMHNGVFQDDVGLGISKPGIEAKWFRREEQNHAGALINIHNEDHIGGAELRLAWPALKDVKTACTYLWGGELQALPVRWENEAAVVAIPTEAACSILLIAGAPETESVRAHCYWPLEAGPDKIVLALANTSTRAQKVALEYRLPEGVTLTDAPSELELAAGSVWQKSITIRGIAALPQRGKVMVQVKSGECLREASCVVAPPLVNRGFETDSVGNGTPDMWQADGNEIFLHLLQNKELPAGVQNSNNVIHYADGIISTNASSAGKNCLLLKGKIMWPYLWERRRTPDDPAPVPIKPFYFKTAQPFILKPGTSYQLALKHRQDDAKGALEVSMPDAEWPYKLALHVLAKQTIPAGTSNTWQTWTHEFRTPDQLPFTSDLTIANHGDGSAWIDNISVEEIEPGPGK